MRLQNAHQFRIAQMTKFVVKSPKQIQLKLWFKVQSGAIIIFLKQDLVILKMANYELLCLLQDSFSKPTIIWHVPCTEVLHQGQMPLLFIF